MDKIFKLAIGELGQKEISGSEHNPSIVNYAKEAGFDWINDDETPWCSIFINWLAKKTGLQGSNKLNARSWLLVGKNVDASPEPGDVIVFWRDNPESWKGHVGIFFGFSKDGKRAYCLGGNQGNQVSISAYPSDTILGFRRLTETKILKLPDKILKIGDTGDSVKQLQEALKVIGIDCGTSDGCFGEKTDKAVKYLQSMKTGLKIDGVYGKNTKDFLFEILIQ